MNVTAIERANMDLHEAVATEGAIHDQLVAIDIVTNNRDGYFDPKIEGMTMLDAVKIMARIDHPDMNKPNCDLKKVYKDLDRKFTTAINASDRAAKACNELEAK